MEEELMITEQFIMSKILFIRNQKVMIDSDLAILYGVENKQLKRQVRRNIERFPEDFMFELTSTEYEILRSQFGTLNKEVIQNIFLWRLQNKVWRCFQVF